MKLRIGGHDYEAVNHRTATVADLLALRQQTAGPSWEAIGIPPGGLGMRALERMARTSARAHQRARSGQDETDDPADVRAPDDGDLWLGIVVFLTRRAAGEKVTLLEAMDIAPADIEVLDAPEETDDEPDPSPTGGAGPATPDDAPAPTPSAGPSTTSPDPSGNGCAWCPTTGPASPH